jgi:putative endonuclease
MEEHRSGGVPGFNQKYKVNKLLFFEQTSNINDAIAREKQLKNWHREWKLNLIRTQNPDFHDLYEKTLKQVQGDNLW